MLSDGHRRAGTTGPAGPWLLLVAFVAGAALMAYEIVGSRVLAPSFGSSLFVWGSLIGVFLASLSIGYAVGGRLADRHPTPTALSLVLAGAALLTAATVLVAEPVLGVVIGADLGSRLNPFVSAVVIFGPASVLIGMVTPWAVRLRAGDLAHVGRTAGSLYGISTAGSILGTFAAAFWLLQLLGTNSTILAVAAALAACALLTAAAARRTLATTAAGTAAAGVLLLVALGAAGEVETTFRPVSSDFSPVFSAGGYDPEYEPSQSGRQRDRVDSTFHRIRVVDYAAGQIAPGPARVLHFDNSLQAAVALDGEGKPDASGIPIFGYLRAFELVPAVRPDARRVLFIGLGSGAAAMRLHELRPELQIDVVEVDPAVVETAREWFDYRDADRGVPQVRTHVGDGRSWLAASDERWDAIVIDAYFAESIPFHLTTREFLAQVNDHLADDGVAMANLIGAVEGRRSELLRTMVRTWRSEFDDVAVYPVPRRDGSLHLDSFDNVELLAGNGGSVPARGGEGPLLEGTDVPTGVDPPLDDAMQRLIDARYASELEEDDVRVLTDDYAPVDALISVDPDDG